MPAESSSWAPERFVAFLERIDAADPEILQHRRIERKQGATLTINPIVMAQPPEHTDPQSTHAKRTVNGTFPARDCIINHHYDPPKVHRVAIDHGEDELIYPTNKFYMTHHFL